MIDHPQGEVSHEGMTRSEFLKVAGATGLLVTASGTVISVVTSTAQAQTIGEFGPLFVEPFIYYPEYYLRKEDPKKRRVRTNKECIKPPNRPNQDKNFCKPAAGQTGLLPDGRFLYMNALEGSEDNKRLVFDADKTQEDGQSRVLTINYEDNTKSQFLKPFRATGGIRDEIESELIPGMTISQNRPGNNGDFFCSHQCHLPNGSLLAVGGTHWYQEAAGTPEDPLELEGLQGARFFDYKINTWVLINPMNFGRWYPTLVPLPNGDPLVFSGVGKLVKPIYLPPQEEGEPPFFDSGGNVLDVERLDLDTGKWKVQGEDARRSLPLMPRIHLLPNGMVCYNGAGQAFSPLGQDRQQVIWNFVAVYDPEAKQWIETGIVAGTGSSLPGSKLSTHEVPLLQEMDDEGNYTKFEILNGGGTTSLGALTNPGSFFPTNQSRIDTFDTTKDPTNPASGFYSSVDTGTMFSPPPAPDAPSPIEILDSLDLPPGTPAPLETFGLGRWYGDGRLLPDGTVFVSGGSDRDEVFFPGNEFPILECEMFDRTDTSDNPNGSWKVVGQLPKPRTYHNINALLPTGQVIIGGHNPISFGYVSHDSDVIPGTRNRDGRDPTFQIYSPPYVSDPNRPKINVRKNGSKDPLRAKVGRKLVIPTKDGADIEDVVIIKISSGTHINDTEQRGLILPVIDSDGSSVTAQMPKTAAELGGQGFYLAFIRSADDAGKPVPSEGVFVKVPNTDSLLPS